MNSQVFIVFSKCRCLQVAHKFSYDLIKRSTHCHCLAVVAKSFHYPSLRARSASKAQRNCKMDGIELCVRENRERASYDRMKNEIEKRSVNRRTKTKKGEVRSRRRAKCIGQRTPKNNPQDVKERREPNRRPMTNFIEKRSREHNRRSIRERNEPEPE